MDPVILDRISKLHTALLCDVLDGMDHRETFFGPAVRRLAPGMRVAGRAFTLRAEPVSERPQRPYRVLLEAYSRMRPGDVVVLSCRRTGAAGLWGELLSVAACQRGVTGMVTDGLVRDVEQIAELGFPVFATGASPLDSDGRQEVVAAGEAITLGEATVHPGDLVVGDAMGAIAVPAGAVEDVVRGAEEKVANEHTVRAELEAGEDIAVVFERHEIL